MESAQWVKAETALRRAKTLRPDDAAVLGYWAGPFGSRTRRRRRKACWNPPSRLDPDMGDARNYLASLLMATGNAPAAERQFREAVGSIPQLRSIVRNWRRCWRRAGRSPRRFIKSRLRWKRDPELAPARLLLGQLLLASGDGPGGIRELEAAIRLKPDSGRAHYELGVALARTGNREEGDRAPETRGPGSGGGRQGRGAAGAAQSRAVILEPESQLQGQDARSALARECADIGVGVPESSGGSGNTVGR